MFTKYCVLNKQGKFDVTIFMHYTDIAIFVSGHFILTHPVDYQNKKAQLTQRERATAVHV